MYLQMHLQQRHSAMQHQYPIPALRSPARVTLIVNSQGVTNSYRRTVIKAHSKVAMIERLKSVMGWTDEMIDMVQWKAIRKGLTHLSAGPKTTMIKHMNGILPIGHRLVRTGLSSNDTCRRCNCHQETDWHMIQCYTASNQGSNTLLIVSGRTGKRRMRSTCLKNTDRFLFDMRTDPHSQYHNSHMTRWPNRQYKIATYSPALNSGDAEYQSRSLLSNNSSRLARRTGAKYLSRPSAMHS